MILLLGGTSETGPIALALAERGYCVLVSTATDAHLDIGDHPLISRRVGRLDAGAMQEVIEANAVRAIVDATHPYATAVKATAREVAESMGIPLFCFIRPGVVGDGGDSVSRGTAPRYTAEAALGDTDSVLSESEKGRLPRVARSAYRGAVQRPGIIQAADHAEAAHLAFSFGLLVLLTTGSRNLEPYVQEARKTGLRLVARVLGHPESIDACLKAGIEREDIITGRGPYSLEDNRSVIRQFDIGVLVTKDSGSAGGVDEKLEAARLEGCKVVVVSRPSEEADGCKSIDELVALVCASVA